MVASAPVLDQPQLEPTSTTIVVVGMNVLGTLLECVKLEVPGLEILLHVKRVSLGNIGINKSIFRGMMLL